jgi:predicted nucleic acid-binding protein
MLMIIRQAFKTLAFLMGAMFLVDTCVVINGFEESGASHKIWRSMEAQDETFVALTDFNLHELEKHGRHKLVKKVHNAIKSGAVPMFEIGVSPGDWSGEKQYERLVDPEIVHLVEDPSDAVLIAAAEQLGAEGVITLDRHHLYTGKLWSYLEHKGLHIFKPHEFAEKYL